VNRLNEQLIESDLSAVTRFVKKYGKPYDPKSDKYYREPFASDVRAGKVSPIYNAHSYHTKVPLQGIEPFILHYTEPGDLVLDPFCGSGMMGIAALKHGRRPILIEISPAAAFITKGYCAPIDLDEFDRQAKEIMKSLKDLADWLYETICRKCGSKAVIEYSIVSDEFKCPRCNQSFLLYDVAVERTGNVRKRFECPSCGKELAKTDCKKIGVKLSRVNYTCPICKRQETNANEFDVEKIRQIEQRWNLCGKPDIIAHDGGFLPINGKKKPLWFPNYPMMFKGRQWGDTWRAGVHRDITHAHHFFTIRNLWFLASLWDLINNMPLESRIREKMRFLFSSILTISSKMGRYGKRTGNVSGTLYVPSLIKDMNVYRFLRRKIWGPRGIYKAFKELAQIKRTDNDFALSVQSATNLSNIPSESIDYVFTDPPFGGNLMYSELNFLWESWLNQFTETNEEAIINNSQGKGIAEYKGLMTRSFKEIYRVLKPGRWMSMVFHNSDGRVWQAIQEGLSEAGFVVGMIGTFDKKQRSFKQVTSTGAVGYDVVVNCYKPKATVKNGIEGKTTKEAIIGFIADKLRDLPISECDERTARMLHSKTIGFFMQQNKPLGRLSFEEFKKILEENFREIDEHWYLPFQRPKTSGQKKLFGFISSEAEAIEWLETFLNKPRKYGDIIPDFFRALGPNQLKKELQKILEENFIEEKGAWRNPTTAEKERLIKKVSDHTARQIDQYLRGSTDIVPTDTELCEWIEFCYRNGLYQEGSKLFEYVSNSAVDPETWRKTKKIAEVCKNKLRE